MIIYDKNIEINKIIDNIFKVNPIGIIKDYKKDDQRILFI